MNSITFRSCLCGTNSDDTESYPKGRVPPLHKPFTIAYQRPSPDSMGATTQYCELRYGIAIKLMEFSEGNSTAKQITLACLRDVLHDPTAPKSRVQKFISNLTD